jgi:trans-aconitate methyltransferase
MTDYDAIYRNDPGKWTAPWRDQFAHSVIEDYLGEPKSLLDIGCGNGHTIAFLKERWHKTEFSGTDTSAEAIRLAKTRVHGADFYQVDHGSLGMRFHAITIMGVAEHFEDIVQELSKARRLLDPGGMIYLEAPNNLAISGRTEEGFFASETQAEWHLKRSTWESKFAEAGLKVVDQFIGDRPAWEFVWLLESEKE